MRVKRKWRKAPLTAEGYTMTLRLEYEPADDFRSVKKYTRRGATVLTLEMNRREAKQIALALDKLLNPNKHNPDLLEADIDD